MSALRMTMCRSAAVLCRIRAPQSVITSREVRCISGAGASSLLNKPLLLQTTVFDAASRLYSRQTNQSVPRNQGKNFVRLPFDGCGNIDDVLRLALKDIDNLPPNQTAAAWTFILRLLTTTNDQRRNRSLGRVAIDVQGSEQLEQQLDALFQHTMNSLVKMKYKDLTTVILSIAKVVKSIREANQTRTMNVYHQALESLLQKTNPFGHFAMAADRKLIEFDARHLSNLAYAYALVGYNPKLNDGSNLFQKIGDRSIICIDQFLPQNLANLVWANATLDYHHHQLFKKVGDHIARLDDLVPFKPQELANILWAYATISTEHTRLFKKVGDHINTKHPAFFKQIGDSIVRFGSSKPFIPQNLANIVWAYAKVGEQQSDLFKMIGHSIAAVNDLAIFKTQHLTNIAWAYAIADIDAPFLFNERFVNELLARQHQFDQLGLMQLHQWHVWQVMNSNDGLTCPLKEKCIDAYSRSVKH
ncbi:hypothetical protein ACHAXN_005094 [Cyclotella atomus]